MPERHLDDQGFVIDPEPAIDAHLTQQAIDACGLCNEHGYRGATVCDHIDHYAETAHGRAEVRAELAKLQARKGRPA